MLANVACFTWYQAWKLHANIIRRTSSHHQRNMLTSPGEYVHITRGTINAHITRGICSHHQRNKLTSPEEHAHITGGICSHHQRNHQCPYHWRNMPTSLRNIHHQRNMPHHQKNMLTSPEEHAHITGGTRLKRPGVAIRPVVTHDSVSYSQSC